MSKTTKLFSSVNFVIALFIGFNLWIYDVNAQTCSMPDFPNIGLARINNVPLGKAFSQTFQIQNTLSVTSYSETNTNQIGYFDLTYVQTGDGTGELTVSSSSKFLNYEQQESRTSLILRGDFDCNVNTVTMFMTIAFMQENNYAPQFATEKYEIELPLPLPNNFDVTLITGQISATDYDLSYNEITFTSDITSQPFRVETSDKRGTLGKEFFANILTANSILNLREDMTFKIIATDSDPTNPKWATADVTIKVNYNEEEPIELPIFRNPLYRGTIDLNVPTLYLELNTIELLSETYIDTIVFELEEEDSEYFEIYNRNQYSFAIKLKDSVSETILASKTRLSFVVKAIRPDNIMGNAAVLIDIIPKNSLDFKRVTYTGTIKSDMATILLDIPIQLTSYWPNAEFSINDDTLNWFEIEDGSTSSVNEIIIKLQNPLTEAQLEDKILISLTITATDGANNALPGESHVILGIEREDSVAPVFEKHFYEGTITKNLELEELEDLKLVDISVGTVIYTLSDYDTLFQVSTIADGARILKTGLTAGSIEGMTTIQFTVIATTDKGVSGFTVIILKIEQEELEVPQFTEKLYRGTLKRNNELELDALQLSSNSGPIEFGITGEHTNFIKIKSETATSVTLELVTGVSIEDIGSETVLTVIVTAKLTDTLIGATVVMISVEEQPITINQPKFEKNFYTGSLSDTYDLILVDNPLKLIDTTFTSDITFAAIGDDAQYFTVQQIRDENLVEILFNLPTTTLEEFDGQKTLTFSVVATSNGIPVVTGTTTIVIDLPTKLQGKTPTFTQPLYEGWLDTGLNINIMTPIEITPATFTNDIQITLEGYDYALFDYSKDANGIITITSSKITSDIVKENQLFKFNVRATNGENFFGVTSIVIERPLELVSDVVVPQFEQSIYKGVLPRGDVIQFQDIIAIRKETYSNNLHFTLSGGNSDMFNIINVIGSNEITIEMKSYTDDQLAGKNVLHFAIIGKLTDNIIVTTAVVIDITPVVTLTEPKFMKSLYVGTLSAAMDFSMGETVIIAPATFSNDIEYSLSGDDHELFEISPNSNEVEIRAARPIQDADIFAKTNLRFSVTARKENGLFGETAIVVDIPVTAIGDVELPQFEKPIYTGILKEDLTFDSERITLKSGYSSNIQFSLDNGGDSALFEITNQIGDTFEIKLKNGLDELNIRDKKVLSFAVIAKLGHLIEGTAAVLIDIEKPNTVLVPQFEQPLYDGALSMDFVPSVVATIKLTEESYSPDVQFELVASGDGLFKIDDTTNGNVVMILGNDLTAANTKDTTHFKLVINAKKMNNLIGSTVVVINNPHAIEGNTIIPKFDKPLYAGSISTDLDFTMLDTILIVESTFGPDITFNLEDEKQLFRISGYNANRITVALVNPLQASDIMDQNVLRFVLTASRGNLAVGTAIVFVDIESPNIIVPPQFENALYTGTLSDTFDLTVDKELKLIPETYSDMVSFELVDAFDYKLFDIITSPNTNNVQIVPKTITEDDILFRPVLQIVIRATKPTGLIGTAVVVINIPSTTVDVVIPEFEKTIYKGSLTADHVFEFNEIIQVKLSSYSTAVEFNLADGDDSELFEIVLESDNVIEIDFKQPIDPLKIDGKTVLSFTLLATVGPFIRGTSTVIIDVMSRPSNEITVPEFKKLVYLGSLSDTFELKLDEIPMLTDESVADDIDVLFDLVEFDYGLFELDISPSEPHNVIIKSKGINEGTIKGRTLLQFIISATKPGNIVGTAVVQVNIPKTLLEDVIVPEFENAIYRETLSVSLELSSPIAMKIIETTITPGIEYQLKAGDESRFFEIKHPIIDNEIEIDLITPLQEEQIENLKILTFTVEAILQDVIRGTAMVIVDIPNPNAVIPPIFKKSLYVGSISDTFEFNLDDDEDEPSLTTDTYSPDVIFALVNDFDWSLFTITYTGNSVTISLNEIDEDTIKSRTVLKIVISATKPGNIEGTTVVLVKIPQTLLADVIVPEFEKSIYRDTLSPNRDLSSPIVMKIIESTPGIKYELKDGDDSQFFDITVINDNEIEIITRASILESQIEYLNFLTFTVEAIVYDVIRGTAMVIVDIPDPDAVIPPIFKKSLYVGSISDTFEFNLDEDEDEPSLTIDTYSPDVIFALVNDFDWSLFTITYTGNSVTISLNDIDEDTIKSRTVLKIVISATKPGNIEGTTVVLVKIPQTLLADVIVPEFEKSIYRDTLSSNRDLSSPIVMKIIESMPGIKYELKAGDDSQFFDITVINDNEIAITTSAPLLESQIENVNFLTFTVEAIVYDVIRGTAMVIIDIPDPNVVSVEAPIFKKSLYVGSWNEADGITVEELELTDESYTENVEFEMVEEFDSNLFSIETTPRENYVKILANGIDEDVIQSNSILKLVIKATKPNNMVGTTVVLIELQDKPSNGIDVPQFEEPLYRGLLNTDFEISIEKLKIDMDTYSDSIIVQVTGQDSHLFSYQRNNNEIEIVTLQDITESDLVDRNYLQIFVTARLSTGQASSTVVIFEIPLEGCQIPNEDTTPKFDKQLYDVIIKPEDFGVIFTVFAEVPSDPLINVIYGTEIESTDLSAKLGIHRETGIVTITAPVTPGIYYFKVKATNPTNNVIADADVKLTVTSIVYCDQDLIVSHALIVRYLKEETVHPEILDATITEPNCAYRIVSVNPNSLLDLFDITGDTFKLSSGKFDRESVVFEKMAVPQIRIHLEFDCQSPETLNGKYMSISYNRTRMIRSVKDDSLDDGYYVYTDSIRHEPKKTILSIIIEDVNDNSPVFQNPVSLIGYPESELAEKLLPPYLIKVYATDQDAGDNAKIRYTINPNPHFGINGETGIVYPLKNAMASAAEFDLLINAKDQDGDGDGNETPLTIKVMRLAENNFIVISVENEVLENLDVILRYIESESGLKLNVLNAVVVSKPPNDNDDDDDDDDDENLNAQRSKRSIVPFADNEETVLRIIGYAFNVNGQPIVNTELESKLSQLTSDYVLTTTNLGELIGNCDNGDEETTICSPTVDIETCDDECDTVGFIVGIIILAIFLLIACVAIFVMWWKWIRPYRYEKRNSSNERLDNDFNETGYTAPVTDLDDDDGFGKSNVEIKNENKPIPVVPPTAFARSLQAVLDVDNRKQSVVLDKDRMSGSSETDDSQGSPTFPSKERKKSIKFNETVERIDIHDVDKEDTIL